MEMKYDPELVKAAHEYSLPQLYEAFINEHNARKNLEKALKRDSLVIAGLRADMAHLQLKLEDMDTYVDDMLDNYLKLHIYKNIHIKVPEDMPEDEAIKLKEETINFFFDQPGHKTYFTESGGYICIYPVLYQDFTVWYYMIEFMWADENNLKKEMQNHLKLIKDIYKKSDRPFLYTGIHNVAKNHCVEIADRVWMLTLDDKFDNEIESFREIFKNAKQIQSVDEIDNLRSNLNDNDT
jgi:hypothetical protein